MQKLITVVGTTASGKSDLAIYLAKKLGGEIISCDSRQVYKGLDLGTGKVTKEEQQMAKHHLLDVINPNEKFSVAHFQKLAYNAINDVLARGKVAILAGGTGLYSRSVVEGYPLCEEDEDDALREQVNSLCLEDIKQQLLSLGEEVPEGLSPRHLQRRLEKAQKGIEPAQNNPLYEVLQLVLVPDRDLLYERIRIRLDKRLQMGMIDEVKLLKEQGATNEFLEGLGLEYRYINRYLNGEYTYEQFYEELFKQIRHFAKRQVTWFKKEKNAVWLNFNGDYEQEALKLCEQFLQK